MNIPLIVIRRQRPSSPANARVWAAAAFFAAYAMVGAVASHAQDVPPPQPAAPAPAAAEPPRTHVDTTVVGDAVADHADAATAGAATGSVGLSDNDHHFEAGAPAIVAVTSKLHLSGKQNVQVKSAIEKADAGAAILIKRDHDVYDMIAATTPQDPLYPQLIKEQSTNASLWTDNRDALRRDVLAILTPAQQAKYEQLEAKHAPKDNP